MFAPLLCLLISGFVVHLFRHKKLRPSRKRLLTGLVLCLPMCLFAASHRNGFEVQCGQNGCRGFRSMQLLHLLSDVQKDLHEAEAPNVLTVSAERKYRYEQYRRSSRSHADRIKLTKYREDYLQFSGGADCTAQITHADYQRAAGRSSVRSLPKNQRSSGWMPVSIPASGSRCSMRDRPSASATYWNSRSLASS
jgi:hypothetical protein